MCRLRGVAGQESDECSWAEYKTTSGGLPVLQPAFSYRLYSSSCKSTMAGNQAIHVNPPNAQEHISTNGSDWLWAAFSIQAFSFLAAFVALVAVCLIHVFHRVAVH